MPSETLVACKWSFQAVGLSKWFRSVLCWLGAIAVLAGLPIRAFGATIYSAYPVHIYYETSSSSWVYNNFDYLFGGAGVLIYGFALSKDAAIAAAIPLQQQLVEQIQLRSFPQVSSSVSVGVTYYVENNTADVNGRINESAFTPASNTPEEDGACQTMGGNPIQMAGGTKYQTEPGTPSSTPGALAISFFYSSEGVGSALLGPRWRHTFASALTSGTTVSLVHSSVTEIFHRSDQGRMIRFTKNPDGTWAGDSTGQAALVFDGTAFVLTDRRRLVVDTFDTNGTLLSRAHADGRKIVATRTANAVTFTDQSTRQITFALNSDGRAVSATLGGLPIATYAYSGSPALLSGVAFLGQTGRSYQYGIAGSPDLLTSLIDELGATFATWTYDTARRATSSVHGSAGADDFYVDYTNETSPLITKSGNYSSNVSLVSVKGRGRLSSKNQPAGSGCAAAVSSATTDADGNMIRYDDFNGNRSCIAYDVLTSAIHPLPNVEVSGLSTANTCESVVSTGAAIPSGSRKTTTRWHPEWFLKTAIAEPGRLTTLVYNGQPDPFNGGSIASCAPATALLPGGKAIPVLCKRVEQATSDADGRKGFDLAGSPADPSTDSSFANVSLLLHFDGAEGSTAISDYSGSPNPVSPFGNTKITNLNSKFSGSAQFDGVGDFLLVPHSPGIDLSTGDFTLEAWVRTNVSPSDAIIINKANGTGYYPYQLRFSGGKLASIGFDAANNIAFSMLSATTPAAGVWHHVAVVRSASSFKLFINGVLEATATFSGILRSVSTESLAIGAYDVGSFSLNGQIDDLRITKGVARYAANFTPPLVAFGNSVSGIPATPSLIDASVPNRVQSWTYNANGQVLTAKGPRTDVNDTTTFVYYTDTVFTGADPNAVGHTIGDLQTFTNAVGKVTTYGKYNKAGQVLEMTDPNGVLTVNTYDARQRLQSVTVGGQTTGYTFDAVGQLTRVTRPDTSYIGYEYDDAHRQKAVFDNIGNRIEYTLDNAGNRTAENVKDPGGLLRRQLSRSIDALGRVQQTTGRE